MAIVLYYLNCNHHRFHFQIKTPSSPVIEVDDTKTYQTIDGFGFALTQGSAMPILKMNAGNGLHY